MITKPTDDAGSAKDLVEQYDALAAEAPVAAIDAPVANAGPDAAADAEPSAPTDAQPPAAAQADANTEDAESDLLPRGNPLRFTRGIAAIVAGGIPAFLLMAKNRQNAWGVPLGFVFIALCAWGVMDLLGTFDDADERVAARSTLGDIAPALLRTALLLVAFGGSLAAAQSAMGPWWLGSVTVTASFLGLVAAVFDVGRRLGPWKTDELGLDRPLLHRHGFWVLAVGGFLYMPAMGLQSLWDPWETHYGEVAREILARDDWVSLWWAQDGWFWSKPILNFWIQSLAMATLGTHFQPDQMLAAASGAGSAHPEWAVRAPNVLMTIGAMYLLYKGVAKVFGRRAGLLGALVLATLPDWFFLAHQTMTDMPFVAAMTAAMGLLLLGLNTDEDARVKVYEVDAFGAKWRVSLWHLVFGLVLLCALPQIIYLVSRNIEFVVAGDGPKGFHVHWDEFKSGSAGNCGLPGNEACATHGPNTIPKFALARSSSVWTGLVRYFGGFEPSLQGIVWGGVIGGLLYANWGERRARRIIYVAAWLCAAMATMAKGPAGFGLPIICALAYVATKRRWSELLRLEMLSGLLVILAVALPWYVAMYVRHGSPFTDRLIFHDMFNRAFSHVHDTNEGDDTGIRYYAWQLGYAIFPWTGLAPLALIWNFRRSDSALAKLWTRATAVGDASVMLVMWFLFAFALFTFMGTKFHHYIFPAVPPVAMLVGIVLDDMLGQRPLAKKGMLPVYSIGMGVAAAASVWGASRFWPGSPFGGKGGESSVALGLIVLGVGIVVAGAVAWLFRERAPESEAAETAPPALAVDPSASPYRGGVTTSSKVGGETDSEAETESRRRSHEGLMIGGAAAVGALVIFLVGRDLVIKPEGSDQPGAIRLLQLFTYNYRRPWPDSLDFSAILAAFTLIAGLLALAMGARALRRHAIAAFCALALIWGVWGLDVYMVKLSPHWGQHELVEAYYRDRKGPDEPLVAYQMNWKGENFYTGNHVPAFVSTGATFQTWLKQQRDKGVHVLYFLTEHSRTGGLRSEVAGKGYKEMTDKALCNKFVLVRIEL